MNDPDRVGTSSNCGNKNEDCRTHVEGKRRLVVCCDGTWNDSISTESPITNVSRISRLIKAVGDDGVPQILSYQPGIGSGTSKLGSVIDGMTGRGSKSAVKAHLENAQNLSNHPTCTPQAFQQIFEKPIHSSLIIIPVHWTR